MSCACELILLLGVEVCSVRAVPKFDCRLGTHTHKQHLAHDDQWEVIYFSLDLYLYIFSARLAQWYRQLAALSRLNLCLSVDDSRSQCKQLQAVSVIPVPYLILFVCDQESASRMVSSLLSTSTYHARLLAVGLTVPVERLGPVFLLVG